MQIEYQGTFFTVTDEAKQKAILKIVLKFRQAGRAFLGRRSWTHEDDAVLYELHERGASPETAAQKVNRTPKAVILRWRQLMKHRPGDADFPEQAKQRSLVFGKTK